MIYTDSIFKIGSSHEVCEDYAYAGAEFAGISDGCSGSNNTDVGARLLLHSAYRQTLDCEPDPDPISVAKTLCPRHLSDSLYATLLYSWMDVGDIKVKFQGDGFLAFRCRHTGIWFVTHKEFIGPNGESMPPYPIYRSNDKYFDLDIKCTTTSFYVDKGTRTNKDCHIGVYHDEMYKFSPSRTDVVLVGSDGWSTFPIPFEEIIVDLLDFKNFKGQFIKRRVNAQLKKWGMEHFDDISLAGISVQ